MLEHWVLSISPTTIHTHTLKAREDMDTRWREERHSTSQVEAVCLPFWFQPVGVNHELSSTSMPACFFAWSQIYRCALALLPIVFSPHDSNLQSLLSCWRYSGHVVKAQGTSMVAYAGEPGNIAVQSPIPHNTTSVNILAIQFKPMRTVLHIRKLISI